MATYLSERTMRSSRRKTRLVQDYKASVGCACGESDPRALDLHHRDESTKHTKLSPRYVDGRPKRGGNRWGDLRWEEIVEEIADCDVLCANCHRKLTYEPPLEAVRIRPSSKETRARAALGL